MQLKITTDYAIRIVLYLAMNHRIVPSKEIADNLCIPQNMVLKTGKCLNEKGLIDIMTGTKGGFELRKPADKINLLDVIEITEPTLKINRCLETDRYCSRNATETCPVRETYSKIQEIIENSLRAVSIEDFLE